MEPGESDRDLLSRFRQGQDDAATQLYLKYAGRLHALARKQTGSELQSRVDPEDIVQSVFRTFFRRAALGQYSVPDGEELWKLFLVIALNKARATGAYHRAAMRDARNTATGTELDILPPHADGNETEALTTLRMTIDEILAGLPESSRRIITLRIEGNDVNAIAATTGRAKRSVERILQEFRNALASQLEESTQ
ncbi:MAG: hypothetical protein K1X57_09130 [Gemmataceae bacterium]|nr:hypothetical protein [Gemmataceae bacterium]